jgi:hypothetical protein
MCSPTVCWCGCGGRRPPSDGKETSRQCPLASTCTLKGCPLKNKTREPPLSREGPVASRTICPFPTKWKCVSRNPTPRAASSSRMAGGAAAEVRPIATAWRADAGSGGGCGSPLKHAVHWNRPAEAVASASSSASQIMSSAHLLVGGREGVKRVTEVLFSARVRVAREERNARDCERCGEWQMCDRGWPECALKADRRGRSRGVLVRSHLRIGRARDCGVLRLASVRTYSPRRARRSGRRMARAVADV